MAANTNGPGPTSHTFFSQRLRLSYVDYGSPDKPLLVLVHGSRDHARSWDFVAAGLADHYHVIAPDLRGHGDSAWAIGSQYAMAEYLLDLTQLLRHVGKSQATLVGHSLGGAIALHYTGIFPDSVTRVTAIEGLGPPPTWRSTGRWNKEWPSGWRPCRLVPAAAPATTTHSKRPKHACARPTPICLRRWHTT